MAQFGNCFLGGRASLVEASCSRAMQGTQTHSSPTHGSSQDRLFVCSGAELSLMLLLSCSVLLPGVTGLLVGAKNPAGKVIKENTTGCDKACEQANQPITRGQRLHPDDLRVGPSGIGYLPAQCLINKTVHCHWVSLSEPFVQPTQRWHAQYRARVSSSNTSDKTPDPAFCPKSSVVIQFS